MIVDSNGSSPYRSIPNHQSLSSNPSESRLDPIIHYHPRTSEQHPSPHVNTHRRKIFENRTSYTEMTAKAPVEPIEQADARSHELVESLYKIENKLNQIEQAITQRDNKSSSENQNFINTLNRQQVELQEKALQIQQTDRKIANMLEQKEQYAKDIDKLKQLLGEKDRKAEENKSHANQREMLIKKEMQLQFLLNERTRSERQYLRIKNSTLRKEDYKSELERIKRKVQDKANYSRRRIVSSYSEESHSNILKSLKPIRPSREVIDRKYPSQSAKSIQQQSIQVSIQPVLQVQPELSEKSIQYEKKQSVNSSLNKTNRDLYITRSLIYPFDEAEKEKLP